MPDMQTHPYVYAALHVILQHMPDTLTAAISQQRITSSVSVLRSSTNVLSLTADRVSPHLFWHRWSWACHWRSWSRPPWPSSLCRPTCGSSEASASFCTPECPERQKTQVFVTRWQKQLYTLDKPGHILILSVSILSIVYLCRRSL